MFDPHANFQGSLDPLTSWFLHQSYNPNNYFSSVFFFLSMQPQTRAVPEFGSGSGRNPAFFANPVDIRLRPKLGRISAGAGFGKLSLNYTNLDYL